MARGVMGQSTIERGGSGHKVFLGANGHSHEIGEKTMTNLRNSIRIGASPEIVWEILGNPLGTPPQWIPGLATAKMDGQRRLCTTSDGNEIEEEVQYSDETKSFSYVQIRVPLPIRHSRGTMRVQPEAEGSTVIWDAEFEPLDPTSGDELARMIDGYYKQTLESLHARIETSR